MSAVPNLCKTNRHGRLQQNLQYFKMCYKIKSFPKYIITNKFLIQIKMNLEMTENQINSKMLGILFDTKKS